MSHREITLYDVETINTVAESLSELLVKIQEEMDLSSQEAFRLLHTSLGFVMGVFAKDFKIKENAVREASVGISAGFDFGHKHKGLYNLDPDGKA